MCLIDLTLHNEEGKQRVIKLDQRDRQLLSTISANNHNSIKTGEQGRLEVNSLYLACGGCDRLLFASHIKLFRFNHIGEGEFACLLLIRECSPATRSNAGTFPMEMVSHCETMNECRLTFRCSVKQTTSTS